MSNTHLIKHELIDTLCAKRSDLLSLMSKQVKLIKDTYSLCHDMDALIPAHPLANYDYLNIIFLEFKSATGESAKHLFPKDVNILSMGQAKCEDLFTRIVDKNLWSITFNRLNIFSLMSSKAKTEFRQQLKDDPLPFTVDNVMVTLENLMSRQDQLLIDGLIDSIQTADGSYVCNDGFKFNKNVIFENACFRSHNHFVLNCDGAFKDTITFLSKIVFGNKTINSVNKMITDTYLWAVMNEYFTNEKPERLYRDEVEFEGGKVVFFNNGNAHLNMEQNLVDYLNQQLSNTRGLKAA